VSAEDKEFRVVPTREETTEEYSFDALAKGLANGVISRREALKLVGTAILGTGVLAFFPGAASRARLRLRRVLDALVVVPAATSNAEAA
jgi:hypothetical protein